MGETVLRSPLRTARGRFLVSLPEGGRLLVGTPEAVEPGSAGPGFCIPVQEMVAVRLGTAREAKGDSCPARDENSFTVFFVQREKGGRWSLGSLEFTAPPESELATRWVTALQIWISHHGITRPKSLLVFINPAGGRKKAVGIYQGQVASLFALAGIHTHVIETSRTNEAHEYILHQDLCSTDCVCFATVGINDPVTSALHIIIGDSQPLDVCSIRHNGKLLRYSVSLAGYGFYGDVVSASEKHRWMGPVRYTYAGAKAVLSNRSYEGTVEFQVAGLEEANPRDQTRCRSGCLVCSESTQHLLAGSEEEKLSESEGCAGGEWQQVKGRFLAVNVTSMSSACPKSPEGLSPCAHLADGTADLILVRECSTFSFLRHLTRHTNSSDQ
ncbi:PREDICTED: ceramide kinase-like, partial [Gekko japonicus]|uniref:Ceramide kinase-like n=1 Tax=Gekko japonicus TaxID=146911 RepID=A0ABM1KML2_GEKJA